MRDNRRLLIGLVVNPVSCNAQELPLKSRLQQFFPENSTCSIARLAGPFDLMLLFGESFGKTNIRAELGRERCYFEDWLFEEVSLGHTKDDLVSLCLTVIRTIRGLIKNSGTVWHVTVDVTADISYAFAVFAALRFLESFCNVKIEKILRVNYSTTGIVMGFVDMTDFMRFLGWIDVVNGFIRPFRYNEIIQFFEQIKEDVAYSELTSTAIDDLIKFLSATNLHGHGSLQQLDVDIVKLLYQKIKQVDDLGAFESLARVLVNELLSVMNQKSYSLLSEFLIKSDEFNI